MARGTSSLIFGLGVAIAALWLFGGRGQGSGGGSPEERARATLAQAYQAQGAQLVHIYSVRTQATPQALRHTTACPQIITIYDRPGLPRG